MSEKPAAESAQEKVESGGLPTPNISPASSGQPTSAVPDAAQLVKELAPLLREALLPDLSETVRRQAQSSVDGATREFGKIAKHLKKYTPEELSDVADKIAIEEWREERNQRTQSSSVADRGGSSDAQELSAWAEQQLLEAELPMDDPDIIAHFNRAQTADQFRNGLQKMVVKKLKQGKSVTAASVAGEGGRAPTPPGDKQEQIANLYAQLQATHKEPSKHADERKRIKADIAKLEAAP